SVGERGSGMNRVISDRERAQRAAARLRVLQHFDHVTHNISRTCRFFGVSRTLFYEWRRRYLRDRLPGPRPRLPSPRVSPFRTPPHIEALVLRVRQELASWTLPPRGSPHRPIGSRTPPSAGWHFPYKVHPYCNEPKAPRTVLGVRA